ncbi:MAG: hypothetical protein Q8L29_03510 [archaeon]|nr:hypothetical protein [archaeon]
MANKIITNGNLSTVYGHGFLVQDITRGNLISMYGFGPFDQGKSALESKSYRIISAQEMAKLRIQEGVDSDISIKGNWIREGFLYVPNKGKFITKKSPTMVNAREATSSHRNGTELDLTSNQVEEALSDSIKILDDFKFYISTQRFADNDITNYLFGEDAEAYGQFLLKEAGIKLMPINIDITNLENKPLTRQLWLHRLGYESCLSGGGRNLSYVDMVRGVKESA